MTNKTLTNFASHLKKNRSLPLLALLTVLGTACSKKETSSAQPETQAAQAVSAEKSQDLTQTLNDLKIDVKIGHFNDLLGEPTHTATREVSREMMVVQRHGTPKKLKEDYTYTEYLYVKPEYFVQAVTDEDGDVGLYSITVRSAAYLPEITTILDQTVQLGKTVYHDLVQHPRKIGADFKDSKGSAYYEIHLGHPDAPLLAIFSTNRLGYVEELNGFEEGNNGVFVQWFALRGTGDDFPLNQAHEDFRKTTTFNTYTVAAPWFRGVDPTPHGANIGDVPIQFGPRPEQLNQPPQSIKAQ